MAGGKATAIFARGSEQLLKREVTIEYTKKNLRPTRLASTRLTKQGAGEKCSKLGQMLQVDLTSAQHLLNPP